MGQLMAKLMGIFGKQGKGRPGHPSDRFDQAPARVPRDWGELGNLGLGGSCTGAPSRCAGSPAPSLPAPRGSRVSVRPRAQAGRATSSGEKPPPPASCDRDFALGSFPDPSGSWQALSSPEPSDNHFSGIVERGRWGWCPGPWERHLSCWSPPTFWGVGEWEMGAGEQKWYRGEVPQPAGDTCLLRGRSRGSHSPLVIALGPDPALPSDACRAQGYHRGPGQRGKVHHPLPVVSDSRGGGRGLCFSTRLTNTWANHRTPPWVPGRSDLENASGTFLG